MSAQKYLRIVRRGVRKRALRYGCLHNGKTEIRELSGSCLVEKHVRALDIAVGDPVLVQKGKPLQHDTKRAREVGTFVRVAR